MQQKKNISLRSRGNSFTHAFNGLRTVMKEPNAILHAIITAIVIIAGFAKHLSLSRWMAVIFAIGLVWVTEAFNTALEVLCDYSCDRQMHPEIKIVKDVAAGAVLLAAITSAIIGIMVFFF